MLAGGVRARRELSSYDGSIGKIAVRMKGALTLNEVEIFHQDRRTVGVNPVGKWIARFIHCFKDCVECGLRRDDVLCK